MGEYYNHVQSDGSTTNNTFDIINGGSERSTTLITALYNIGRDNLSGKNAHRSFSKYLNWFKNLLIINVPMVIFVPDDLQSYVLQHRPPSYLTKIIVRPFEDLLAYKNYHDKIQRTIDSMTKEPNSNGQIPSYFRECPEFITAKYETIIYSKFDLLYEVSENNPFNTKYFIWLDAGTFYQEPPFNYNIPWPDPYKIQLLGDKFLVSDYNFNIDDKSPLSDKRSYLRLNRNEICAFILGGTKHAISVVHSQFWNEVNNALDMGVINNEQHILQLMALEHPENFYVWYRTRYQYPNIGIPIRDRMIPCELAVGTFMGEDHFINPNIKVLTVATVEIPESSYQRWELTAKYYGFNYEVIGRNKPWRGFGTKIRLSHERLKSVTEPYVVLTDCTDVFFCGSSTELYDKFIKLDKQAIVGGELKMYYPQNNGLAPPWIIKGKHNKDTIKKYFESIQESLQAFPNSGFIMGRTEHILELMELHLEYDDDQSACFDTIYEKKYPLSIDYGTSLIGNVPNYKEQNSESVGYFKFDPISKRYKNIHNDEAPVVLHFPGKNWYYMQEFYSNTQASLTSSQNTDSNNDIWVFFGIVILIIVFILIVYYIRG